MKLSVIPSYLSSRTWLMTLLIFISLCLCAAFADFSTKGEPREALVAVDMLSSGNWTLPIDNSGDMAYKPPMFHWLVTLFSLPAGHVTEFTSRLPSVLALTLLWYITFRFAIRAGSRRFAIYAAMFLVSCFEVLRAGTIARVDMLLALFMSGAMITLFLSEEDKKYKLLYVLISILCLSGGALTKGPVGIVLPLGAWWIWGILSRKGWLAITGKGVLIFAASLVLPALWYWQAYKLGGERFLHLALEENFGRFTGSMSYDSHVKPLWYNFTSLLTGLLPWSLMLLISLFFKRVRTHLNKRLHEWRTWWHTMTPEARFSMVAASVIFVFYCIPKSKRSVYLLPMYPFLAYALSSYTRSLIRSGLVSVSFIRSLMGSVCALLFIGFAILFPFYSFRDSDQLKAKEISAIVPSGNIYTFVPDRFMRFYITDFYLGGRLCSLLPSGQVENTPQRLDASLMRLPQDKEFYLLTTSDLYEPTNEYGLCQWLEQHSLTATPLYNSKSQAHDIKGNLLLLKVSR